MLDIDILPLNQHAQSNSFPPRASKIDCPKPKSKRSIVSIDYETVRKEVIDASSISTQLINTIQWQTIQALGWSLGGIFH